MCGIIGYLGNDIFNNYIISGLKLIQNRGYDSVGVSTIIDNTIKTIKYASTNNHDSLEILSEYMINNIFESHIGIGHTRWATHGAKIDINAHPHNDNLNRISLVHNGIIENYNILKEELMRDGYFFLSHTDTEVISVLIGYYLDKNYNINDSIQMTVGRLRGTWALAIIYNLEPNKIWVIRNGSPLLLGIEENFIMIASESIAFNNYINKYIVLDNHDLIEITYENNKIIYNKNIQNYKIENKSQDIILLTPEPYRYWLEKEIIEQIHSVNNAINNGGRILSETRVKLGGLDYIKKNLLEIDNLILLGCGTSYNAGLWAVDIFKSLDIFNTVTIYDGAEFKYKDIPKLGKTGLILLSQSGETKDLHLCINIAKEYNLITIGVVNVVDSMIARETDCGVYLNAGREVSVASTKSFTNQCIILSLIAVWFSQERNTCLEKRRKIISDIMKLSWQIENVINQWTSIKELSNNLDLNKSFFILGKGQSIAICHEIALKIKEIALIHAEAFSSSSLKHGPCALIVRDLPIFILDIDQNFHDKNMNTYEEVKSRYANVLILGNEKELYIDKNNTYGGILANIYMQILAFEIALKKGYNPDYPPNLAKVVTVE